MNNYPVFLATLASGRGPSAHCINVRLIRSDMELISPCFTHFQLLRCHLLPGYDHQVVQKPILWVVSLGCRHSIDTCDLLTFQKLLPDSPLFWLKLRFKEVKLVNRLQLI